MTLFFNLFQYRDNTYTVVKPSAIIATRKFTCLEGSTKHLHYQTRCCDGAFSVNSHCSAWERGKKQKSNYITLWEMFIKKIFCGCSVFFFSCLKFWCLWIQSCSYFIARVFPKIGMNEKLTLQQAANIQDFIMAIRGNFNISYKKITELSFLYRYNYVPTYIIIDEMAQCNLVTLKHNFLLNFTGIHTSRAGLQIHSLW